MLYSHIHVQAALRICCHFCILFLVIIIAPIECLQRVYLTKHLMFKRFLFVLWNDEKSSKALFLSKQCDPFNSKLVKVLKMMKDVLVYERKQTSRRDVLFWWVHSIIWNIWLINRSLAPDSDSAAISYNIMLFADKTKVK